MTPTSRPTIPALPYDIWRHIAEFILPLELESVMAVNSALFELAMEQKYRQISFAYLNNNMVRTLLRLRDPAVARRVRVLYIYPHFVKEVIDKVKASDASSPSSSSTSGHKTISICARKLGEKLLSIGRSHHSNPKRLPSFKSPEDVVHAMLDVLGSLPNVTDYHISWSGLPTIGDLPVPFLASLFRPTLKRLWFDISLERLRGLLTHGSFAGLQGLEELELFIRPEDTTSSSASYPSSPSSSSSPSFSSYSPPPTGSININSLASIGTGREPSDINHILIYQLAPAINHLRGSLKKLSIRVWQPLDLSPLFYHIDLPTSLQKICLEIPMAAPHLGEASGLAVLLNNHSGTLNALSLRASQLSGQGLTPIDTSLCSWMSDAIPLVTLPHLKFLEISLNLIPFDAAVVCLKQLSRPIRSLSLTGAHLTFRQVETVLDILGQRQAGLEGHEGLKVLRLGSVVLCPELLDLLAERLQGLEELQLLVREVVPFAGDVAIFYASHGQMGQDESQVCRFMDEMATRQYSDWRLTSLSFFKGSRAFRPQYEHQCRQVFMDCLPKLVSFS